MAKKRAEGGKIHEYNAQGSPAMESARKKESSGFKRGGRAKKRRATGGPVMSEGRAEGGAVKKLAHGGSVRGMKSRGGSPMSSAANTTMPPGKSEAGHEGESVGSA